MPPNKKNGHKPTHPPTPQPSCHCVHIDNQFEAIVDLVEETKREMTEGLSTVNETLTQIKEAIVEVDDRLTHMEDKMAQTLQDVKDALDVVVTSLDSLKTSVDSLIAQGGTGGTPTDTTDIVTAINTINGGITDLKTAVDAALGGGTTPTVAAFDAAKAYVVGDKVVDSVDGQTYVAIQDGTGNVPSSSPDFWALA